MHARSWFEDVKERDHQLGKLGLCLDWRKIQSCVSECKNVNWIDSGYHDAWRLLGRYSLNVEWYDESN